MIVVAFILSIIASLIVGFALGTYSTYLVFRDEAKKVVEK